MASIAAELGPVRGRARIDVLDILRGIAILGILFMNIPFMGTNVPVWMNDVRRLSWSASDQVTWAFVRIFWDGTQRGLFEFLFGAGALVLTAKAMRPTDPVAVADLFYRRNLLLIGFGLLDIFLVCWVGDILLVYGLAALVIFPFRTAPPKLLFALGLLWALTSAIGWPGGPGIRNYHDRADKIEQAAKLEAKQQAHQPLTKKEAGSLKSWNDKAATLALGKPPSEKMGSFIASEAEAHQGGPLALMQGSWATWYQVFIADHETFLAVLEAVCGMFIGMALFKWGVIQGERSMRFYAWLALGSYLVGCGLRALDVSEILRFTMAPKLGWITGEFARLAVTLGHVGLFNLLVRTALGHRILSPFKAVGRMAFSIYVATSVVMLWFVFAPWGLDLWNKLGWAQLYLLALVVDAGMLVLANLWLRGFASGPLEWVWRSLAYGRRQPFRRASVEPVPLATPLAGPSATPGDVVAAPLPA